MDTLLTTRVTPDQIDHLGHMNVRFYAEHARAGSEVLLESLDLTGDDGPALVLDDIYTRHHREQLVDSPLEVRGGVHSVDDRRLRIYEELRNTDTGEPAAVFVMAFHPVDPMTRLRQPLAARAVRAAASRVVEVPEHGRPRSFGIDDDPVADAPTLEELIRRDLAIREVRSLTDAECDDDGVLAHGSIGELVWGGKPVAGQGFMPYHDSADGSRIAWATMETRASWALLPRVGQRVQSFGATVGIADKTMVSRHWVYEIDAGVLAGTFSVVSLAFDLASRAAVPIPDEPRAQLTEKLQPDLAPRL